MSADGKDDNATGPREPWWPPRALRKAFALAMETGMGDYELAVAARKRKLLSGIAPNSRVLDIGIGTGPNLAYLPENTNCVGLEPNEFMQPYASQKASRLAMRNISLEVMRGKAEDIPAPDESFDAVLWYVLAPSDRDSR
jgi:SAM-dependent methyltransferase